MKKKYKSNNLKLSLVALLLVVTIGYATLQTNRTINGTSKINNSTWNVHFNNPTVSTGSVAIDTTKYANAQAATKDSATSVSYNVLLSEPGDFYEFTVPVQNEGTIDAMIDTITSTIKIGTGAVQNITSETLPSWLNYSVTYSDGGAIAPKHELNAGTTETYKVRVEFKRDITNAQLEDAAGKELQLTFSVEYVQKDSTAVVVNHPFTGTKYGVYPYANRLYLNQAVPANAILHNTPSEALADWTNPSVMNYPSQMPYYFKHKIENDVITESYVVFTVTDEMAQANPGMVSGTYELREEKTSSSENGEYIVDENYISLYYEANKETIKTAFGYSTNPSRCTESIRGRDSYFSCWVSGLNANANANGNVNAIGSDSSICNVISDGNSYCD